MLVRGDKLSAVNRAIVLNSYVHRWTHEMAKRLGKCPGCATHRGPPTVNGIPWHEYHAPIISDNEWLKSKAFHVTQSGDLDSRYRHCEPACMVEVSS